MAEPQPTAPAAISWGPDRIDLFERDRSGRLTHRAFDGTVWSTAEDLGGTLVTAQLAVGDPSDTPGVLPGSRGSRGASE